MTQDYFVDVTGMTFTNPNLAAVLSFLKTNEEFVLLPILVLVAGIIIFMAIWRTTRSTQRSTQATQAAWRTYTVKDADGKILFEHRATDVNIDTTKDGEVLNFLGDPLDDTLLTVAFFPWGHRYSVTSIESSEEKR
jgi:hypothetical protein